METVAKTIRRHLDGIAAEALNGLFQSAKRKARCCRRLEAIRTVFLLIAGKLDFAKLDPHAA